MRVLLWSELFLPYIGGAEIFAAGLMKSLAPRGVEFLVVTSHHDVELPDAAMHEGVPIRRFPFRSAIAGRDMAAFAQSLRAAAAIKREFAPDLIHVNGVGPSVLFHLQTIGAWQVPFLVTMQQEVLASESVGGGTLLARTLDAAAWIAACSDCVLEKLRSSHPSIVSRSSRIYNGVEPPALDPAPLPERPHILCLGRLVPAKGFDVALRAFALLAADDPDVHMTIAGDGAAREDLVALARSLGLDGRVRFAGWIEPDGVPRLLNEASLVVMPSRREGLPVAAIQAALMARPIISTAAGGLPEIVRDGETGILTPAEDPRAIAGAAARLIAGRATAEAMGRRGREHALSALAWSNTVASYHALYNRLGEKSRANAEHL